MEKVRSCLGRKKVDSDEDYVVHFRGHAATGQESGQHYSEAHHKHRTNYIRTTKYTPFTFIPLNLFSQFRRFYNLYFLLSAILVAVPLGVAPISPVTQILPLCVVIGVTAVKDAYEDIKRWRADKAANSREYEIVGPEGLKPILSSEIRPGMIIRVKKDQSIPADLILISTPHDDGLAYISTAELDGETNLKRRQAIKATASFMEESDLAVFDATIVSKNNTPNLYSYQGVMNTGGAAHPLSVDQLLLRGSMLRNTEYAYGFVLYVGRETKIMLNLKSASLKFSSLEGRLNLLVFSIFFLNLVVLIISVALSGKFQADVGMHAFYLDWPASPLDVALLQAVAYYILFTYLIPISLFVSLEITRLAQSIFMYWDNGMISSDGVNMRPQNSNLNEDLGRIGHVFSDKTGTLTKNIMRLRSWYIPPGFTREETGNGDVGRVAQGSDAEGLAFHEFFTALSVCHTVIPSHDTAKGTIVYEADSPDETALLAALKDNGVVLTSRTSNGLQVEFWEKMKDFELVKTLPFNSTRKRMSVLMRAKDTGEYVLYCKGADNVVLDRSTIASGPDRKSLEAVVERYAREGLRTLVTAKRAVSDADATYFLDSMREAETALVDRDDRIAEACEAFEKDMTILGATAVEDELQDDVADTIAYLLRCGIHVWMLTGDRLETAISIGLSTKLLDDRMTQMVVNAETLVQCEQALDRCLEEAESRLKTSPKDKHGAIELTRLAAGDVESNALIITGASLVHALEHFPEKFFRLGEMCISVICCRVTPLQKSQVVRLVRKRGRRVCLAIGDGANDVSMIQTAHVGVGIIGLEGTQAVRASDFAFKEFRALKRLIAFHGRYSYIRMANLIYYSFYKNITMIGLQFWYGFISGWSAQPAYQELILAGYNLVFLSLPPLAISIFERDVDEVAIDEIPELYREVQRGRYWNPKRTVGWAVSSLYQGALLFTMIYFWLGEDVVSPDGRSFGYWAFTDVTAIIVISVVIFRWAMLVYSFQWPMHFTFWLSYIVFFIATWILFAIYDTYIGVPQVVSSAPSFYFMMLVAVVAALLPDFFAIFTRNVFSPMDSHLATEMLLFQRPTEGGKILKPVATYVPSKKYRVLSSYDDPQL